MADANRPPLIEIHYDVLGVAQSAGEQEIRDAEMAMRKIHDHRAHLGDAEATDALRKINEATAVLLDPQKRAEYDRRAQTLWEGFADVGYGPPAGRGARLRAVHGWLSGERDALREATLLDAPPPHRLLTRQRLLGDG
ncbi:MAG: J domain-containing protein [Minicystis sp.]